MKRNITSNSLTDVHEEVVRLYSALDAAGIGTWSLDPASNELLWDERCQQMLGLVPGEAVYVTDGFKYIHPDDLPAVRKGFALAMDPAIRAPFELECRTSGLTGDQPRWIYCKGKAYFNEHGTPERLSGIVQDITGAMQSRELIATSEQLAQMALNGADAGIFRIMLRTDDIEYSPTFALIVTGDEKAVLNRADFIRHVHPDDRKLRKLAYEEAERTGRLYYESRVIWNDGSIHWMRVTGRYLADATGRHYLFTGTALDITAETEAGQQKEIFNSLIAASHDWMGIAATDGGLEFINTSGLALQGIDAGKVATLHLKDICTIASGKILMEEALPGVLATGQWEGRLEFCHLHRKRILIPVYLKLTLQDRVADKGVQSIIAVGRDLRGQEAALQAVRESEALFRNVTNSSPTGLWLSDKEGGLTYLNRTLTEWTGMAYKDLLGVGWAYAIIDEDRPRSTVAFQAAIATRTHYDVEFRIKKGDGRVIWCRAAGDPYFNDDGSYAGYAGFCMDIDDQVAAVNAFRESEARFRSIVEQAPMAIGLLSGREMIVEVGNAAIFALWGKDPSIVGLPLIQALPELEGQPFLTLLANVLATGKPFYGNSTLAKLVRNGIMEDAYFDFAYTPLRDDRGALSGVMVLATEVTEQVIARKRVEESEAKFRALIAEAPVATCFFTGREMRVEIANSTMLEYWGKDETAIGQALETVLPELKGQPFPDLLDKVYTTGQSYSERAARAQLLVDGELRTYYFNYTYKPLRNAAGEVYGVINMASDVTAQVLDRRKLEDAESSLRSAIELAELATWQWNLAEDELVYSERLREWFGFTAEETSYNTFYNPIIEEDRERIRKAMDHALSPEGGGHYNEEYRVKDYRTGQLRFIHALGRVNYGTDGQPLRISGTAQDVTRQREARFALERQVQERTEELLAVNEELKAANEELNNANQLLMHSNEELAQYAYVASHDLQEPLRKIRMFSGMLSKAPLAREHSRLIAKIGQSSERMTMLIRDLLDFSRLLKAEAHMNMIDLNLVASAVVNDFELAIEEKSALVAVGELPIIEGVALQMNQLFYNLLSNALKFTAADRIPQISITSRPATSAEVRAHISRPAHDAPYYRITFSDNGIGFEPQYAEQIFEVFKRLHGRDYYPGSGIGLALCRRIVANHHGHLNATSTPGIGTIFHVLLPGIQ